MILDLSNSLDKSKAKTYFNTLLDKKKKIELKELKPKRSIRHNAYLHVCISIYAIEFGYNLEEAKTLLKRQSGFMKYTKNGNLFLKRTRDMLSDELSKFIEFIRDFSAKQGCYIPTSEEYKENSYSIDKHINNNKQYL